MSSVIAIREGCVQAPNTPADPGALLMELRANENRLNASFALHMFGHALNTLEQPRESNAHFFLLQLNPSAQEVRITGFRYDQSEAAAGEYMKVERQIQDAPDSGSIAVLVSVDNVAALRRAYPNYFLDTRAFAAVLDDALAGVI